ncbi:MAG: hypothetical protein ACK40O_00925 [Allosphingosinicella sp.]
MSGEGAYLGGRHPRAEHGDLADVILRGSTFSPALQEAVLKRTASRVVASFADALDAGTLKPSQHGALRDLERALAPYLQAEQEHAELKDSPALGMPPPDQSTSALSCPAADLTDGDDRQRWAMGRPGA